MFNFADHVSDDIKAQISTELDRLPQAIEEIIDFDHGADIATSEGNCDYCVVADFADRADYETYAGHPDHLRLIADHIKSAIKSRNAVQFEI